MEIYESANGTDKCLIPAANSDSQFPDRIQF